MLRAYVMDFEGSWDQHLPFMEFAYNNRYHSSIRMAPFEVLYGRKCRSLVGWFKTGDHQLLGPELIQDAIEKVQMIRDRLRIAQSRHKSYTDIHRRQLEFEVTDHVFLKVSPFKGAMRFGKKGKLSPIIIRPFQILDKIGTVAYKLALLLELGSTS
ncbi:putative Retrotransposon protein, Ty3-gypsy subclass [Quillaja saponaria]|uniref:Retrotransposon protein, Ty3-gypsy subclass n=1 Tax=Quillaja saponaria TaxID=32244 RepID=A0AAD7QJX5_QUISA|nr:putative Retrotransposon protein, Ty3-gypsy subclass [Quillaja saponaria]